MQKLCCLIHGRFFRSIVIITVAVITRVRAFSLHVCCVLCMCGAEGVSTDASRLNEVPPESVESRKAFLSYLLTLSRGSHNEHRGLAPAINVASMEHVAWCLDAMVYTLQVGWRMHVGYTLYGCVECGGLLMEDACGVYLVWLCGVWWAFDGGCMWGIPCMAVWSVVGF